MKRLLLAALLVLVADAAQAGGSSSGLPIVGLPVLNGVPGQILSESLGGALVAGTVTPAANASGLVISGYSLTGANAQSLLDLSGTWNTTGAPSALKLNITNTASNANSLLADFQVGSVSQVAVGLPNAGGHKDSVTFFGTGDGIGAYSGGNIGLGSLAAPPVGIAQTGGLTIKSTAGITFAVTTIYGVGDITLVRDAAGMLAQRNGVNAQISRVYNTFTDLSNYERIGLDWQTTANVAIIGAQAAGTGTLRPVQFTGAGFTFGSAPAAVVAGEIASPKITASGVAPGAGFGKMEWVAGTNAGSCKLEAYAGTSTTPVTIVDNVGSGC